MTESKKKTYKVGDVVDVKEGRVVRRPDGVETVVTGGRYVLSKPGTYNLDDTDVEVKA